MSGKGDKRRPQQISNDQMAANWMNIFEPGDVWVAKDGSGKILAKENTYEKARDEAYRKHPGVDIFAVTKVRG